MTESDHLRVLIDNTDRLADKTDRLADKADAAAAASASAAGQLAAATIALEADQTERREFEKMSRTAMRVAAWVLGVLMVLVLVVTIICINLIAGRGQTRARIAATQAQTEEVKRLTHLMLDCTQPDGDCYRQGQSRTAAAVKQINDTGARVLLTVAVCRYKPDPTEFFSCLSGALPDLDIAGVPGVSPQ